MTASHYTNIRQYLLTLATPREELQGHAICPYLKQYMDTVTISTHTNEEHLLAHIHTVIAQRNTAHVMVCDWPWDYHDMERTVEILHHQHQAQDWEFLFMHPDSEDAPLPLADYNFEKPLVIVQIRSKLREARGELAKNTDYYQHFNTLK
jgi:hypothetical protein